MMTTRNAALAGIAGLLALSVTGCGLATDTAPGAGADKPAAADPKTALAQAVPTEEDGAYKFAIKGGTTPMTGVLDVPKKAGEVKVTEADKDFTLTMSFRTVGEQAWTKIAFKPADLPGLPEFPNKWLLLDNGKLKDQDLLELASEADPGNAAALVDKSAGVKETGPGTYAGTVDLAAANEYVEVVDGETLAALGDEAKTVPFEAVVEGGNLTSLTLKIPAAGKTKAQTFSISYTGFGQTETPAVPADDAQQKAPADVYEMLNG